MTIDNSVNDLLEGGSPGLKFPAIGTTHKGTIISAKKTQQRDMDGKPKFWDDGNPAEQLVINLQTDYRDEGPQDDGVRRLFVKGEMLKALRLALKGNRLLTGGELAVRYTADGEAKTKGFSPPKLFIAQYRPPSPTQAANDLLGTGMPTREAPSSASWATDGGTPAPAAPATIDPFAGADFTDK